MSPTQLPNLPSSSSVMERKPRGRTGPSSPRFLLLPPLSSVMVTFCPPSLVLSRRIDPKYLVCHYWAVTLCGSAVRGTLHAVHEFTRSWLYLGLILTSLLSALFFISFYFFGPVFTFMTLIQHQIISVYIPYRLF